MGAELEGRISGDARGFLQASKQAQSSLSQLTKSGGKSGKSLTGAFKKVRASLNSAAKAAASAALKFGAVAAAAGTAALAAGAIKAINLAREQIKVEKALAAVLKSTGGAAGLSAKQIKAHASALQQVTNFGDEAIIGGQNLLLTFTNIGKDVFPQATETILNMSQALGTGLKESAIQLGKALNDPIKGVSALSRVGVSFTQTQKDQIKLFQEGGQSAKAQQIILKELGKEFGGAARAAADPLIQLQNAIGDVGEELGKALLPTVNAVAEFFTSRMTAIQESVFVFVDAGKALFKEFADALGFSFASAGSGIDSILATIRENKDRIVGFAKEIARTAAFVIKAFVGFGKKVRAFIQPAVDAFKNFLERIGVFKTSITDKFAAVAVVFETLFLGVKVAFQGIATALAFGAEKFLAFRGDVLKTIAKVLRTMARFSDKIVGVLAGIATGFTRFGTTIKLGLTASAAGWLEVIENVIKLVLAVAEKLGAPTELLSSALQALQGVSDDLEASMTEDAESIKKSFDEMKKTIGEGIPIALKKVSEGFDDAARANEEWRKIAESTFNLLKQDTKATATELADIEGRFKKIKDAIGEVTAAGKDQQKQEEKINDSLKTRVRLREKLDKPRQRRAPRRRAGGGRRGFLQLGIVRGQRGAGFPGLAGAAGQFGTVGARAGQAGGAGRAGGMVTGPGGRPQAGTGAAFESAGQAVVQLFRKFGQLAKETAEDPEIAEAFIATREQIKAVAKTIGTDAFAPAFEALKKDITAKLEGLTIPEAFTKAVTEFQKSVETVGMSITDSGIAREFKKIQKRILSLANATGPAAQKSFEKLASRMNDLSLKAEDPLGKEFLKLAVALVETGEKAGEAGLAGELAKASQAMDDLKNAAARGASGINAAAKSVGGDAGFSQGRRSITGRRISDAGQIESRQFGGFLSRTGMFRGHAGEFVIRRRAAQAIGPADLRRMNRSITINNTINATDRSTMGTRAQIRQMLPELRRQTRLGVRQGGPF